MIEDNSLGLEFKYLIVNDMDRKFGLWVNTVGYQSISWSISQKGVVCFHPIPLLKSRFVKAG